MHQLRSLLMCAALAMAPLAASAADHQVVIDQHMFMPAQLTIHPGEQVTWINKDTDPHTVFSNDHGKTFRSAVLDPGRRFSRTFPAAGTFAYYCSVHPYMQGTVIVK
ncbi:MAG: cupredoxin domain-containing protein [Streptosporangiaceae bacterium]